MFAKNKWGVFTFIIIELLLYSIFMMGDISGHPSSDTVTMLKFLCIILCNIFALVCAVEFKQRDNYILLGALFFTGISDYFLLFTEKFTFGMITFCVVQMLYLLRIWFLEESRQGRRVLGRMFANILLWAVILLTLYKLKVTVNLLLTVSVFYFISILQNVITGIKNTVRKPDWKNLIFAAGMFLFILCDINVGIYNMNGFIAIENAAFQKLYNFSEVAMWMFYLPAQVCIAVSGKVGQNV